jgi:hypothetical protein
LAIAIIIKTVAAQLRGCGHACIDRASGGQLICSAHKNAISFTNADTNITSHSQVAKTFVSLTIAIIVKIVATKFRSTGCTGHSTASCRKTCRITHRHAIALADSNSNITWLI